MVYADICVTLVASCEAVPAALRGSEAEAYKTEIAELLDAAHRGAWKTVCFMSGQIVEGLLAKRLTLLPVVPNLRKVRGLGDLVLLAREHQVLPNPIQNRPNEAAVSTVRLIRNASAHYRFSERRPTPLNAAQAAALLLCACEALFPSLQPFVGPPELTKPLYQILHTRVVPVEAQPVVPDICRVVAQQSLPTMIRFANVLRANGFELSPLGREIAPAFPRIVRRASTQNSRVILTYIDMLRRFELRAEARVFAVLLPLDGAFLSSLLAQKSPVIAKRYILRAQLADNRLMKRRLTGAKIRTDDVAKFWTQVAEHPTMYGSALDIVRVLPPDVSRVIIRQAPSNLLTTRRENVRLYRYVALLRIFRSAYIKGDEAMLRLRDGLVGAIRASIADTSTRELEPYPNFMRRIGLLTEEWVRPLIAAIVERLDESPRGEADARSRRRLLWDIYAFYASFRPDAVVIARRCITTIESYSPWDGACLRGMLVLANASSPDPAVTTARGIVVPPRADRWQLYLVTLSFSGGDLPIHLRNAVPRERPTTCDPESPSFALYSRAMHLLETA